MCFIAIRDDFLFLGFFTAAWAKRLYNFTTESKEILSKQDDASEAVGNFPMPLPYCSDIATTIYVYQFYLFIIFI